MRLRLCINLVDDDAPLNESVLLSAQERVELDRFTLGGEPAAIAAALGSALSLFLRMQQNREERDL